MGSKKPKRTPRLESHHRHSLAQGLHLPKSNPWGQRWRNGTDSLGCSWLDWCGHLECGPTNVQWNSIRRPFGTTWSPMPIRARSSPSANPVMTGHQREYAFSTSSLATRRLCSSSSPKRQRRAERGLTWPISIFQRRAPPTNPTADPINTWKSSTTWA